MFVCLFERFCWTVIRWGCFHKQAFCVYIDFKWNILRQMILSKFKYFILCVRHFFVIIIVIPVCIYMWFEYAFYCLIIWEKTTHHVCLMQFHIKTKVYIWQQISRIFHHLWSMRGLFDTPTLIFLLKCKLVLEFLPNIGR